VRYLVENAGFVTRATHSALSALTVADPSDIAVPPGPRAKHGVRLSVHWKVPLPCAFLGHLYSRFSRYAAGVLL
jgi:hypothetical protein